MPQYTFDNLSGRDFEFLCRDLLQKRIAAEIGKPFYFNTFSEGKDRGIDGIFQNENEKVVLQCKKYKKFDTLYAELKNEELKKIALLLPSRYILATSLNLSEAQVQKLFALLHPYVQNINDIIGQSMINNLLSSHPDVELNHPRLFFNSTTVLNRIIHANTLNQSDIKLREYQKVSKYYVADDSFQKALDILRDRRYVIISGDPGVGKSTLAGMLSLYFLGKDYEFVFLRRSVHDGHSVWQDNKKQIFLFDDFLGSNSFDGFGRNEDRELYDFIKEVSTSKNKLLIITTREYIFRQAIIQYPELKDLQITKCIISQKKFTDAFKINILYNYLYNSDVDLFDIESVILKDNYREIIKHRHFSPRIISEFIWKFTNENDITRPFYDDLMAYLDDPFEYWKRVFLKLSNEAQILLLILSTTKQPGIEEILFAIFTRIGEFRKLFDKGFERDIFENALIELSDSFIAIGHNPEIEKEQSNWTSRDFSLLNNSYYSSRFIEFQNPSIKDFAITYLNDRSDLIEALLKSAAFYHQLFFVFSSNDWDKHINDYESEYPYRVRKILLPGYLQELVLKRAMLDFDSLLTIRFRRIRWKGKADTFHADENSDDNRMEKLELLCNNFSLEKNESVRTFVVKKYSQIIEEDKKGQRIGIEDDSIRCLSLEERLLQLNIIEEIRPYTTLDTYQVVYDFYKNIRFSREFIVLHSMKELFPEAVNEIIIKNKKRVVREIKNMIVDDIDYYMWEGTFEAIDALGALVDEYVDELTFRYDFKLSDRFKWSMNDMTGWELFELKSSANNTSNDSTSESDFADNTERDYDEVLQQQKYDSYKHALLKLVPEWDEFSNSEDAETYLINKLGNICSAAKSEKLSSFILEQEWRFMERPQQVDLLLDRYSLEMYDSPSLDKLHRNALEKSGLSEESIHSLIIIAYHLYLDNESVFRKAALEDIIIEKLYKHVNSSELIDELLRTGLLMQDDVWFSLVSRSFLYYLVARYIEMQPFDEKVVIYGQFKEFYSSEGWKYENDIWEYCYEIDYQSMMKYFIIPVLKDEFGLYETCSVEELPITFLEKEDLSYSFKYWQEDNEYMMSSGRGSTGLSEDIFRDLDLGIEPYYDNLEDCFNISLNKDQNTIAYIKQYCVEEDLSYTIDINEELKNSEFHEIVQSSGAAALIIDYVNRVRAFIAANS